MNPERAARAYEKIAEGYAELALAVLETPGSQAGQVVRPGQSAGGGTPSVPPQSVTPPLAPSFDDLPPDEWQEPQPLSAKDSRPVMPDVSLGYCPDHKVPWVVKAAGVSKSGKEYPAFHKCPAKNGDEFCNRKPIKAWVDSHPIREGAA